MDAIKQRIPENKRDDAIQKYLSIGDSLFILLRATRPSVADYFSDKTLNVDGTDYPIDVVSKSKRSYVIERMGMSE